MPDEKIKEVLPRLLTVKGASAFSGLPIWTIRQLLWAGKIPFVRIGPKYFLDPGDLTAWIEKSKRFHSLEDQRDETALEHAEVVVKGSRDKVLK
jgi:excisionase family DNA binding protein